MSGGTTMAVVHNKFESINDKIDNNKQQLFKTYIISLACALVSFALMYLSAYLNNYFFFIVFLAITIMFVVSWYKKLAAYRVQTSINSVGAEGEELAVTYLKILDNNYHIIPNAILNYGEKRSETDVIVVGPTGVFIVEIKNYKGFIQGNTSDHNLVQIKTDNYGNSFEKPFYNPVKQVGTHRYTLNGVLNSNGINTNINICVFFTNKEACVNIVNDNGSDCAIITDCHTLIEYIRNRNVVFNADEIDAIVKSIIPN